MMVVERHPFQPFLPEGARILFLGSFPPQPHRWCMPFYYPNWINDFWRIMGLIHFGDKNHFCLTGEKASTIVAQTIHCPVPPVGGFIDIDPLRFWRMPSTSRAYPLPLEKKAEAYRQLSQ